MGRLADVMNFEPEDLPRMLDAFSYGRWESVKKTVVFYCAIPRGIAIFLGGKTNDKNKK